MTKESEIVKIYSFKMSIFRDFAKIYSLQMQSFALTFILTVMKSEHNYVTRL